VKYHALAIKRLLDHLADLAGDDESLSRGVLKAIGETWYNLAKMLEDSVRKVKLRPKPAAAAIASPIEKAPTRMGCQPRLYCG
jgi:hypothetical protein